MKSASGIGMPSDRLRNLPKMVDLDTDIVHVPAALVTSSPASESKGLGVERFRGGFL